MKLKWYGHASFRVTAGDGTTIVTDPYTPETSGYRPVTEPADLVIISSDNDSFHCRADLIPGAPTVVNALEVARAGGERVAAGIPVRAIEAMEALDHPTHDPDQNGMYRVVVDGIQIGHMGDVGNPLSAKQIGFFAGVDILLALAGGPPTIHLGDLKAVIAQTRPRLVVPMHFRTLRYKRLNTFWIETFLAFFDPAHVEFACSEEIELAPGTLPKPTRICVLDYA